MAKTSIVMSVYNREMLVKDTLASILRQTEPDLELIIVDDASTDETRK